MWLIYALGGGWGHVTRAASLARAAAPRWRTRILSNSTYARTVRDRLAEAGVRVIDLEATALDARAIVMDELAAQPECLIVDTFPRGIGGELADLLDCVKVPKVLVHRDLNPRYVEAANLREFVRSRYDLILVPGEGEGEALGDLPAAVQTSPWLIRSHGEIPIAHHSSVVVCASGRPEESGWYEAVAESLEAEGIPVSEARGEWPAMEAMSGAAAVVGGGGYNTVHECLAMGIPLVAKAWPRKYDRQQRRIERASWRGMVVQAERAADAAAAVREILRSPAPRRPIAEYANGANEAAKWVGDLSGVAV